MKFKDLKQIIIKGETEFIIEIMEDEGAESSEIKEVVDEITKEINSCTSVNNLVDYFTDGGYKEIDAYQNILSYLVED